MVELIKTEGRRELWTPPKEWVDRWGGKPMKNRYLYVGGYAYWFTCPYGAVPMLNREHISVQERTGPGRCGSRRLVAPLLLAINSG
jgi:hypothetical protein